MKNEIILSVIINSYNDEKYLNQCLDSVISQLSNNVEIIIIDDESEDNSKNIINKKIKNLTNAKCYSIKHSGISVARNYAMSLAKGKYIIFVDGDDYITRDAVKKILIYLKNNNHDVTLFNTIKYFEEDRYFVEEKYNLINNVLLKERDLINNKICARPWRFIYKKEMILRNNISFAKGLIYEDEEWVLKVLYYAKSINYLDEAMYVYRKRRGSITSSNSIEKTISLMKVIERSYAWSLNAKNKPIIVNAKHNNLFNTFVQ